MINNERLAGYQHSRFISRTMDTDSFVDFINPKNSKLYISVVSEAESKSLAFKIYSNTANNTCFLILPTKSLN